MAVHSIASRYRNYGLYSSGDHSRTTCDVREEDQSHNLVATCSTSCSALAPQSVLSAVQASDYDYHDHLQQQLEEEGQPSTSSRLEYIINSMAYIRGELDDLKESDRALLDIFKQLENNVSELSDSISMWRSTGSSGRLSSSSDLDFVTSRLSYCENPPHVFGGGLETILDTSKEDIYRESTESEFLPEHEKDMYKESDSLYLPEHDTSSNSCSPVQPLLKSHPSVPSISSAGGSSSSKKSGDPSPQLRTSTSYTSRLAHSPSITRLQDETGSNISRNSSIDSGIQFASEAENGSANGVEPMQVPAVESEVEASDVRKSVGFADDILSALGLK